MPPNRIVASFTPIVAVAAGAAATWLADNVPGLEVSAGQLEAIFIAGLVAVLAPAGQWLYGAQKYERHEQELERQALAADMEAAARAGEPEPYGYDDDYDDYDGYGDYDEDYEAALAEGEQPAPVGG